MKPKSNWWLAGELKTRLRRTNNSIVSSSSTEDIGKKRALLTRSETACDIITRWRPLAGQWCGDGDDWRLRVLGAAAARCAVLSYQDAFSGCTVRLQQSAGCQSSLDTVNSLSRRSSQWRRPFARALNNRSLSLLRRHRMLLWRQLPTGDVMASDRVTMTTTTALGIVWIFVAEFLSGRLMLSTGE